LAQHHKATIADTFHPFIACFYVTKLEAILHPLLHVQQHQAGPQTIMISMKFSKKSKHAGTLQATTASIFRYDDSGDDNADVEVAATDGAQANDVFSTQSDDTPPAQIIGADEYKSLGCEYAESGGEENMRKALVHFEKGLVLDPSNYFLWELKSQILLFFDKYLPAIAAAEEVVRLAPSWPEGFVTLARAQREFGEIELAHANMQKAAVLNTVNTEYAEELQEIEEIVKRLRAARALYEEEKQQHASCSDSACAVAGTNTSSGASSSVPPPCFLSRMSVVTASSSPASSSPTANSSSSHL
jgi:tetratricopeptide (TPR) repeat protein